MPHPNRLQLRPLLSLAAAGFLALLIFLFFTTDDKINQANLSLIHSYGWDVDEQPTDLSYLTIPESFDSVFSSYNDMLKPSGFNLTPYKSVAATRYSYRVHNHKDSDSGLIRIHVFVTKQGIIAADICSLASGGFVLPLSDTSGQTEPFVPKETPAETASSDPSTSA